MAGSFHERFTGTMWKKQAAVEIDRFPDLGNVC